MMGFSKIGTVILECDCHYGPTLARGSPDKIWQPLGRKVWET